MHIAIHTWLDIYTEAVLQCCTRFHDVFTHASHTGNHKAPSLGRCLHNSLGRTAFITASEERFRFHVLSADLTTHSILYGIFKLRLY